MTRETCAHFVPLDLPCADCDDRFDSLVVLCKEDVDVLLNSCVPGGSVCDPQEVADNLRAWFLARIDEQSLGAGVSDIGSFMDAEENKSIISGINGVIEDLRNGSRFMTRADIADALLDLLIQNNAAS